MDLFHLVRKLNASEGGKPRFFQCCGHKDGMLEQNRRMRDVFEQEISLQYQYKESRGTHNWYYWNRSLADVLEFFGFLVKTDIYN